MERKQLDMIKDLQHKNADLEKTKKRLEYQIQEMVIKSAQRCAETDQKMSELEIKIRDLEYENRELKTEKRDLVRKLKEVAPSTTSANGSDVIDLDSNDEQQDYDKEEAPNLLDPLPLSSQNEQIFPEQHGFPYSCHICNKSYIQKKRLETHMQLHQIVTKTSARPAFMTSEASPNKIPSDSKKKVFTCNYKDCDYKTTFFPVMARHKKTHTTQMLSCDFYMCDYKTPYRKRYYNHMASKHGASLTGAEMANENSHDEEGDDEDQFHLFQEMSNELITSSMQDGDGNVSVNGKGGH